MKRHSPAIAPLANQEPPVGRVSRVEHTIEIEAPLATVFGFVAAEWETDLAFANGRRWRWTPEPPGTLRRGFQAAFDGGLLVLPGRRRVEVREFLELRSWTARSPSSPDFTWRWGFAPSAGRLCHITQICEYRPRGFRERIVERFVGRRRRGAVVEASLRRLKALVERQVSLQRLQGHPARP